MGLPLDLQFVHLLEHIIRGAPILQELELHNIDFDVPDVLQSLSMLVFNAPSPDLKWHLNNCEFNPNMMAVIEKIVKSEKAKSMRIKLTSHHFLNDTAHYQMLLRTILSEASLVGNLDIIDEHGDAILDILPLLQKEQPFPSTYYPCTSIHFTICMEFLERYRDII